MKLGERMKQEEQKHSAIQWFFMVILIPVLFGMILFGIILNVIGVNVVDHAKSVASNIPFLSEYVKTEEQLLKEEERADLEKLTALVSDREKDIEQLKNILTSKEQEIETLSEKIKVLVSELEELEITQSSVTKVYEDFAKMYVAMSPKNAASILSELPEEDAAMQLTYLKADERALILAKMTPEKAAKLITLIGNN
jgi:flagellar motility protein MotE (MotC chaperone)